MKTIVQGFALELHKKTDKNDSTKVYNSLILYEFNRPYPELVRVSVHPSRLNEVQKLVGQMVEVECDLSVYQNRTSIQFFSAKEAKRAA